MLFLALFVLGAGEYYQNDLGGSSLGMGGVPVGLSNSVECGLYNPAAFASAEKLNFFAGYKLTRGERVSVVMIGDTSRLDYAFPDYLGITFPFGKDFFMSLSLSVPYMFAEQEELMFTIVDSSFPAGFTEALMESIEKERFYSLNPTVGKIIKGKASVGLSLALFWKRSSDSFSNDIEGYEADVTLDKFGIEPCLGLQYKVNEYISVGGLVKKGFVKAYKERYYMNGPLLPVLDTVTSSDEDEGLPLVLGFGTGINLKDKMFLNLSIEYFLWELAYYEDYLDSDDYRNVLRLHLGGQYKFNNFLSLSTGFYTEPSPININLSFNVDSYDQMFLTGGLGLDFGRVALNLSAASSALIKRDPSLREENHFNLSVSYR
jgi:hypothetical protein